LPAHLKLFDSTLPGETWIATATPALFAELPVHVKILPVPQQADGRLDLQALLTELGKQEITSVLVEGGMQVHESFFKAKLVNEVQVYLAPVIIGGLNKKQFTQPLTYQVIEGDLHLSATFSGETHV
jgi:diaminohydroxyphosphoribosylaminopyrimidine deaminase/5-amino-6-(5-phosphoribosylamino)uracil reductase